MLLIQCLFLLLIPSPATSLHSSSQLTKFLKAPATSTAEASYLRTANRLGNILVGHDGRFLACSGKNLFAFERNGSVAWIVPLHHVCRGDITPVSDDRGKIYLVAEDRILKVIPSNIGTSKSTVEVLFGENSNLGASGEIIGLSISVLYSSVFVTIRNRGLFAISLVGELLWSAGPMLYRFGYRQGCKGNITNCYFNSAPAVDQCEGTIYIANTQGQLYSLYIRSPQFRWIRDLSSMDNLLEVVPGNNGLLYVVFPRKATVILLDVSTGNVSWQFTVGPLNTGSSFPVVDSNGWLSIGSLDGFLYSISPTGFLNRFLQKSAPDSVIQVSPVLDCSGFAVYVSQTIMESKSYHTAGDYTSVSALKPTDIVFTLIAPATGTVYWTEKYHGELSSLLSKSDLHYFEVDERIFLTLLAAERIGNSLPCYTARQKFAWTCSQANPKFVSIDSGNERAIPLFLFIQLVMLVILGIAVRFCFVFWEKKKLQDHGLTKFLAKRRSLHSKKKAFSRMISQLEQKAAEDVTNNEPLEQLGEVVKAKEGVERKLSTCYSLGRDTTGLHLGSTILPLYDGNKTKSHSFRSARKESVTIFNTYSNTSSSDGSRSSSGYYSDNGSSGNCSGREENVYRSSDEEFMLETKALVEEAGSSSRAIATEGEDYGESTSSSPRVFTNPMFSEPQMKLAEYSRIEEHMMDPLQDSVDRRRMWLKRRRTLSSTN